jgi:hypothetical protein
VEEESGYSLVEISDEGDTWMEGLLFVKAGVGFGVGVDRSWLWRDLLISLQDGFLILSVDVCLGLANFVFEGEVVF